MGVPKFFAFMYERYPCIMQEIRNHQVPDFDNLYLDVNGILHNCSHPNDTDPHFRITEEEIILNIFKYIELLFRVIQPQKLFFMAVDGVAPRAKMNQQRGRRFRSVREAVKATQKAKEKGEVLPTGEMFDSNCITPGTEFMTRLQEQLKYLVNQKVSTDPLWQRPTVILSGHDTPGEGEHKIMDYIRYLRSQDDWNPHTRHCLYGLDADLIMLGLCTHEPYISLLREEVVYGNKGKKCFNPEETKFCLLHLSLMRDYLDLEFQSLKNVLPFGYNLENIIDDWVLMGFLIGNDFIPHLPNMHIHASSLQVLYMCYIKVLPTLDGYINEKGVLNLERFEKFMAALSEHDIDNFKGTYSDLKYLASKTGREMLNCEDSGAPLDKELQAMVAETEAALGDDSDNGSTSSDKENEYIMSEFTSYKKGYYFDKLEFENITEEELHSQAECYVRAIQWNLFYYYRGCPSWSWYYPHHYAPFISDIKGFKDLKIEFELGTPFKPFQQLLAVLPAGSMKLLPKPYQKLMTSPDSVISQFYPDDFEVDLNGKRHDWEAVILIPFIDPKLLVQATEECEHELTEEEKARNTHGPMRVYKYTTDDLGPYPAPHYFPTINACHASVTLVELSDIVVPIERLRIGLIPGSLGMYIRGFPTLSHIPFTAALERGSVKVLYLPSRYENMMISVQRLETKTLKEWADFLLPKDLVLVNWPHLVPAKVVCIQSSGHGVSANNPGTIYELDRKDTHTHNLEGSSVLLKLKSSMGILVTNNEYFVYVHLLEGERYIFNDQGKAIKTFLWSKRLEMVPLELVVTSIDLSLFVDIVTETPMSSIFPKGDLCVLLHSYLYGTAAQVEDLIDGMVSVKYHSSMEPDLSKVFAADKNEKNGYFSCGWIGSRLGISGHIVARITGVVFIQSANTSEDKVNIGLGLKFNKRNEEVNGYTHKEGVTWTYSEKVLEILKEYINKFPEIFESMSNNSEGGADVFFKDEVFRENPDERVKELLEWKKSLSHLSKAQKRKTGSKLLSEECILLLEGIVESLQKEDAPPMTVLVPPTAVYMPLMKPLIAPDPDVQHKLLDRIIMATKSHPIPIGSKGTIIGTDQSYSDKRMHLYDIMFDNPIIVGSQMGCKENRCFKLTEIYFVNISHGKRMSNKAENVAEIGQAFRKLMDSSKTKFPFERPMQGPMKILTKKKEPEPGTSTSGSTNYNNQLEKPTESVYAFLDAFQRVNSNSSYRNNHQQQQPPNPVRDNMAIAESRDMWNALVNVRQGLQEKEQLLKKEPKAPCANEQTSALKKFLKISMESTDNIELRPRPALSNCQIPKPMNPIPQNNTPQPSSSHCADLILFCRNKGYPAPVYQFKGDGKDGYSARVLVNFKVFYGLNSDNKTMAAETAAKVALKNCCKSPVIPTGMMLPQSPSSLMRGLPQLNNPPLMGGRLPQPPFQWYQNNKAGPSFNPRPMNLGNPSFGHVSPGKQQPQQRQPQDRNMVQGQNRMPVSLGPPPTKAFIPPQLELGNRHYTPHNLHRRVTAPQTTSAQPNHTLPTPPPNPILQTPNPTQVQQESSSPKPQSNVEPKEPQLPSAGRGRGKRRIAAKFSNPILGP